MATLAACGDEAHPSAALDAAPVTSAGAIVNGDTCTAGCFPETGLLTFASVSMCTGTLIAPDVVLTAAHCVAWSVEGVHPAAKFFGFSPEAAEGDDAMSINANAYVVHPQWQGLEAVHAAGPQNAYDVALVFLQEPFPSDAPLATLQDPSLAREMFRGIAVDITGYGRRTALPEKGAISARSERIKLQGRTALDGVGTYEVLTREGPSPHACHGDSGGPLFVYPYGFDEPVQAGIASRINNYHPDTGCSTGVLYARVDSYLDWIETAMDDACQSGARAGCQSVRTATRPIQPSADGCASTSALTWNIAGVFAVFILRRVRRAR